MNQVCTPDLSHLRGSPHVDVHDCVYEHVDGFYGIRTNLANPILLNRSLFDSAGLSKQLLEDGRRL
jgi:hypothetical protein